MNAMGGQVAKTTDDLVEKLRRARQWAWDMHNKRVPGIAHDLAKALAGLALDFTPRGTSEPETLQAALSLAGNIRKLIREADALQPQCVRTESIYAKAEPA